MAKVCTVKISKDGSVKNELTFSYDINVSTDGVFSTTLPKDIVELFKSAGLELRRNRMKTLGYYSDTELDGLKKQISEACEEFLSRELTGEKIVIRYVIQTTCSYCLDIDGIPVPNGGGEWTKTPGKYDWKNGTKQTNSSNHEPYGLLIYARPFVKRDYKYKSGTIKTEYDWQLSEFLTDDSDTYYLRWLKDVVGIDMPQWAEEKEIDYTENTARFFVEMIKGICMLNEKIKDFLEPDAIMKIANSENFKLLGNG